MSSQTYAAQGGICHAAAGRSPHAGLSAGVTPRPAATASPNTGKRD